MTTRSGAGRPWTLLISLGCLLLVAAAAAAVIEGYASDAQERSGSLAVPFALAVGAVLVTTLGVVGSVRAARRTTSTPTTDS
ncbi:hypothetical protein [Cellulosimicrobium marinum]|uniref:hypothetical protein n=1 Tax=Cellulosimicrobium marinum TaxID=1638992 RepID=UPI001E585841|nr:hypothetical protein [Cellulosimicrobium marinum]MCB7135513.1 hypothetical protein [Cellulosimicrobium marinum]